MKAAKEGAPAKPPAVPGLGPELNDSLGFLICDSARYVKRMLSARLAQYGIPGGCWFVLRALWLRDGVSQRELSEALGLAEPVMVMALRSMERLDLVTREKDTVDRRRMKVLLTPRARGLQDELLAMSQEVNQQMLSVLEPGQRDLLVSTLVAVRAGLMNEASKLQSRGLDELGAEVEGVT